MGAAIQPVRKNVPSEVTDIGLEAGVQPALLAFAADETTVGALADFCRDRKIAARVGDGGIACATRYMAAHPAKSVLVVDLDGAGDPIAQIDALAEVCSPGTVVIALGSTNDVTLYRELMDAGVSDYQIKPVRGDLLFQAIETASISDNTDMAADGQGVLSLFISVRGGVGTSTIATNAAWQIASRKEKRVILVDLDLHFGTVALALDLEPGRGLREMLENPDRIDSMFIASAATGVESMLHVLSAEEPLDASVDFGEEALRRLLDEIRKNYDHVIVEIPRTLAVRMHGVLATASNIAVVSDLSLGGMRDTMRILDLLRQEAPKVPRSVIVSRVGADKKHELPKGEFERGIDEKITHFVPEDPKLVKQALVAGKALQAVSKGSRVVSVLNKICDVITVDPTKEGQNAKKKSGKGWQLWGKE